MRISVLNLRLTSSRAAMLTVLELVIAIAILASPVDALLQDVCIVEAEDLSLECSNNEMIVATKATYGRMRLGRCLVDDDRLGCGTDVLFLVDKWCSGRRSCQVDIPNKDLVQASECPRGLMVYLEVEYDCLPARPRGSTVSNCFSSNPLRLGSTSDSLSSLVTDETGCGSARAPWIIEGSPGQRVNISILDFAYTPTNTGTKASTMTCEPYGYIVERKLGINRTVCGGVARRSHVYMSASSAVEIVLSQNRKSESSFVLSYSVIGCPDVRPPDHAWYRRTGDMAEMGCEWSDLSWQVKCVENRWIGTMGNCSNERRTAEVASSDDTFVIHPVLSWGLIIGLAALIALLILVIVIGFVCVRRKNTANDANNPGPPGMQQGTLLPATMPKGTGYVLHTTGQRPTHTMHKYILGTSGGTTNSDLLHGLGTATVNKGQPHSGESAYLAPCLTGSYLAKKYGAPIYDTVGTKNGPGERNSSAGDGDWVQEGSFQFVTPNSAN